MQSKSNEHHIMKIAVAQTRSVKGNIEANIINHKKWIGLAVSSGADLIVFPELSITGYEPTLARALATVPDDKRFDAFQDVSDTDHIAIGFGLPLKNDAGITISMLIIQPQKPRQVYSKLHLHPDEYPYFVSGSNHPAPIENANIAMAICYELSIPEHSANAHKAGAEIYIASVAKSVDGVEKACRTLSGIAAKYSMTVLLSNCVGESDGMECGGRSSVWNNKGSLMAQLDDWNEGILILDTSTQEITPKTI